MTPGDQREFRRCGFSARSRETINCPRPADAAMLFDRWPNGACCECALFPAPGCRLWGREKEGTWLVLKGSVRLGSAGLNSLGYAFLTISCTRLINSSHLMGSLMCFTISRLLHSSNSSVDRRAGCEHISFTSN